ncbi:hypothetical protein K432DRAFT_177893 [Lepidopterella palustris CBS 459.81]|uniref:Uncharacterized protein n=1 Tax=Lepidopterella palustris CBS 459.81 TaxID=1314670 RepID=A0A8E2E0P6_9PEZI|nr:hypothetical protein K432DRAFT_177893 [Lepidopterella palustris CBS 459.81]
MCSETAHSGLGLATQLSNIASQPPRYKLLNSGQQGFSFSATFSPPRLPYQPHGQVIENEEPYKNYSYQPTLRTAQCLLVVNPSVLFPGLLLYALFLFGALFSRTLLCDAPTSVTKHVAMPL